MMHCVKSSDRRRGQLEHLAQKMHELYQITSENYLLNRICVYAVYWTVHHCDSGRIKTNYMSLVIFTLLLRYSTCFRHLRSICPPSGVCGYVVELPHGRLKHNSVLLQLAARIPPSLSCTLTPTHSNPRTIQSMWQFNNIVAKSGRWTY